jgi:HK97 family phage prohead protease
MNENFERRTITSELRVEEQPAAERRISGYAAVFNKFSELMWDFREKIKPGAFAESLQQNDIKAFWAHNSDLILGRNKAGNLKLREDETGLYFDLDLPDTTLGRDAFELVRTGIVSQMSFGFVVQAENWVRGTENEPHIRTLEKIELHEISPVAFPAYPDTTVIARSTMNEMKKRQSVWGCNPAYNLQNARAALALREALAGLRK